MFKIENQTNLNKFEIQNKRFFQQYDNVFITPYFITMLNNYYENKNIAEHLDFNCRITTYIKKRFENSFKNQYNKTIVSLYQDGEILINSRKYKLKDFYIVYKKNSHNYHLICTNTNYQNEQFEYDSAIKFIDTTSFIELIKLNTIKDNAIILKDINTLKDIVHNWDGYLHNQVAETNIILNKKMIGNENDE